MTLSKKYLFIKMKAMFIAWTKRLTSSRVVVVSFLPDSLFLPRVLYRCAL